MTTTRRQILRTGAAGAAVSFAPYGFTRAHAQQQVMSFWALNFVATPTSPQGAWFVRLEQEWNDTHPTKIKVEAISPKPDEYYAKLATRFAAGEGPDLFLLSPADFLRYANNGLLVDLRPHMDKEAIDDFLPAVMSTRMIGEKIFALPQEVEPMAMYYSKAAFADAGLSEKDVPKTYEELIDLAKRLTKRDRYGVLFHPGPGAYQVFTWYPFMWQGGGDVTSEDGRTSNFNHPGTIAGLKLWKDLVAAGSAPREALGAGGNSLSANLGTGYCAMQNCGIWGIGQMRSNVPDMEYGVFKVPTPSGRPSITVAGGWSFVANARGKNVDKAAEFIVWAIGSSDQASKTRLLKWCTEADTAMPPRRSVTEAGIASGAYSKGPLKVFAEDILATARSEPRTPPEVYTLVSDAIQACMLTGGDPARVAAGTHDKISAFLKTYNGARIL